ncbi:hypothetical protein ACFORL_09170 [Legionella dresdenensis]|uniref:Cyclodipeptide synthase n=1 Tax=Legionella dresdenensis TaxID=450200 RepID=A0ABV8CGW1_9GAMM
MADRKLFSQSNCIMPISVGQDIHEGKKFAAVIKLVNASFKECTILVDDSVQHHTMQIDNPASKEILYHQALEEGDRWLERNEAIFRELTIPYKILRWDDWLARADFSDSYDRVLNLYHKNADYQAQLHSNIDEFLARYLRMRGTQVEYDRAFNLCLGYLLEECAVMCLWPKNGYHFEVYPSGRNKAMHATYEYLIKPEYGDYLKSVALRFKKYPALMEV